MYRNSLAREDNPPVYFRKFILYSKVLWCQLVSVFYAYRNVLNERYWPNCIQEGSYSILWYRDIVYFKKITMYHTDSCFYLFKQTAKLHWSSCNAMKLINTIQLDFQFLRPGIQVTLSNRFLTTLVGIVYTYTCTTIIISIEKPTITHFIAYNTRNLT